MQELLPAADMVPGAQAEQNWRLSSCLPAGQAEQATEPAFSATIPTGQLSHWLPAAEMVPGEQSEQNWRNLSYFPAGQAEHAEEPAFSATIPTGQLSHWLPFRKAKVPCAHARQVPPSVDM